MNQNVKHFLDILWGKLPITSGKSGALNSILTYRILGEKKNLSISRAAMPDTAPCPDFTVTWFDGGRAMIYPYSPDL